MTLNFGTDNIFFVPEGKNLCIFDIYQMRCREIDLSLWSLYFNSSRFGQVEKAISDALDAWLKSLKHTEPDNRDRHVVQSFLQNFPNFPCPVEKSFDLRRLFFPQEITLWVRCSDFAQESFFPEDYRESVSSQPNRISFPVMGSVFLSQIGDFELCIPEASDQDAFFLGLPQNIGVRDYPLSPEQILPLDEEYFGSFGSSGLGRVVNLTHDAKISEENLCCTPLFRIGEHFFVTLYFHLASKVYYDVLLRIPERKIGYMRSLLSELGFELFLQYKENEIYKRGESMIHFYSNAKGKESFNSPFLPPFILVTMNEGSMDPATRSKLMAEFLPRFAK